MSANAFNRELDAEKQELAGRERDMRQAIGDLIRTRRKFYEGSITQEELAFRSGISYEHLNHIENYKVTASINVLDRIARALGFRRLSEFLATDENEIL